MEQLIAFTGLIVFFGLTIFISELVYKFWIRKDRQREEDNEHLGI